eukprot:2282028-Amphidinium_carterae.2
MLKGKDLEESSRIQANLAVGHREGRMFRDVSMKHTRMERLTAHTDPTHHRPSWSNTVVD